MVSAKFGAIFGSRRVSRVAAKSATLFSVLAAMTGAHAQTAPTCPANVNVDTILWPADTLDAARSAIARDEPSVRSAFERLLEEADAALTKGPYTVTDKERLPPSGDPKDYRSLATYWWPNPNTDDGLPYIRKDGIANPERNGKNFDRSRMQQMRDSVMKLTLTSYFTGEDKYAEYAAELIRVWFLNDDTSMNPNLQFGQGVPGRNEGRDVGIIDSRILMEVIEAAKILYADDVLSADEFSALRGWFGNYAVWLFTSDLGKEERLATNNHGTHYDTQLAYFLMFAGRCDLAKTVISDTAKRAADQIKPDGTQPEEQERTRSLHYHAFNLEAFLKTAQLGRALGVDIYDEKTRRSGSIKDGVDYVAGFAGRERDWPFERIDNRGGRSVWAMLRLAYLLDPQSPAINEGLRETSAVSTSDLIHLIAYRSPE